MEDSNVGVGMYYDTPDEKYIAILQEQLSTLRAERDAAFDNSKHWWKVSGDVTDELADARMHLAKSNLERDALLEIEKMRDEEIASLREAHGTALVERDALQARIAESEKQPAFGYWHVGSCEDECDFLLASGDGGYCPDCIKLYTHPFIQPAGMMLVPVDCMVTVDKQGVAFGKNCWVSHETITGRTAEQLNKGHAGVIGNQYMKWVQANLSMLSAAPAKGD